ncbi:MAG: prephenate dehydratase [Lachnospiraceae bacterium]|nr:prephenate dehydratase [Lachnospiraceae bacterium]
MQDLLKLRDEIDKIDNEIVALYEKRMKIAEGVAKFKIETGKKVFDKEREVSKLNTLSAKATSEFTKIGILELFEQIMAMSRKRQYQLLTEHGKTEKMDFKTVSRFPMQNARIVFQGVEGAYSQQAMMEYFGAECDSFHVETWKDAMEAIKQGKADFAVLPIENSSAGIVSENYDLLVEYDNYIVGEQIIHIQHALLGLPEANIEDIKQVYSHPQALMQCGDYLYEHSEWEKISMKNTALAAKKIKEDALTTQAAIASTLTAELYGLKILNQHISNNENNATRFIIVSNQKICLETSNKVSICFEIAHESGSLYHMLAHFIYNNINMTNIQSRPIQGKNWEYRFFVDFEGTLQDTGVINALRGIKEEASTLKILGTY